MVCKQNLLLQHQSGKMEIKNVWLDVDVKSKVKSVEMLNKNIPDADASNNKLEVKD
jgi:hypothetical protein